MRKLFSHISNMSDYSSENIYRDQVLKQKMLNDIYKKEREKAGDINLKSDEQTKQQSLIKRMAPKGEKPDRLEGETDEEYQTRLNQWEAIFGVKVKEDMIKERDRLLKNFQRIMSPSEAGEMMSYPQITEDNIRKLNQHWKSFEEELRKKYTSLDFDILEEFILKYIDTIDNGDATLKEVKMGFLVMRDRLDELTVNLEEKADQLRTVMNDNTNRGNAKLSRVYNLLSQLIENKTSYTVEQIQVKTTELMNVIEQSRLASDMKTRDILDSIGNSLQTIQDDISTSDRKINENIRDKSEELKTLMDINSRALSQSIKSSEKNIRGDIDTQVKESVSQYYNILDAINPAKFYEAREEFYDPTVQEQRLESNTFTQQAMKTQQEELIERIFESNIPAEDKERLIQNIETKSENLVKRERQGLYPPDRENPLAQFDRLRESTRQRRERKKQREEQQQQQDDDVAGPSVASSSKGRKMTEYRDDIVRESLKKQDYQSIKEKLYNPTSRMNIELLAREYASDYIGGNNGEKWLDDFNENIFNPATLRRQITNDTISEYIAPLISYARNNYIIKNNLTSSNRVDNPATDYSKNLLGKGVVLNTVSNKNILFGSGFDNSSSIISFGRYELDGDKLNEKNLLITYHNTSMNRVKYFPQKIVSDEMRDLVNYVSSKKKYNDKLFNLLEDDEKLLFKNMFMKSGLSKMMNVKIFDDSSKQAKKDYDNLKEKYYIIEGEINAGNDSPQLLKELNEIIKLLKKQIVYMNKIGLMGLKESNNLILSL
jgi:hypothetical protein